MTGIDLDMVLSATGAEARGRLDVRSFAGVTTDSRNVGEGQLFVALTGPNFDGHDFVAGALKAGASAALARRDFSLAGNPQAPLLLVDDPLTALGDLASAWRKSLNAVLVGLTGSNGKTTTKEMLAAILARRHKVLRTEGNLNNLIGLPLTLLRMDPSHTAAVVEMGMNAPGEIARLTRIAQPEIGLITNVGPAHIGPLGSIEAVARAKTELFESMPPRGVRVVNLDDPFLAGWAQEGEARVVTFGLNPRAMVRAEDLANRQGGVSFRLILPTGESLVNLRVAGKHNVMNALAASATAWVLDLGPEEMARGLEEFAGVKGRLQSVTPENGPLIVDDTYNANPASLAAGLDTLASLAGERKPALILGDMRELGEYSASLHREAGRQAVRAGVNLIFALGDNAGEVVAGAKEESRGGADARAFGSAEELAAGAAEALGPDYAVLVKGSRGMAMERVVKALAETKWEV